MKTRPREEEDLAVTTNSRPDFQYLENAESVRVGCELYGLFIKINHCANLMEMSPKIDNRDLPIDMPCAG